MKFLERSAQTGLEVALPSVFGNAFGDENVELSWTEMVTRGLTAAFGGKEGEGLWDVMTRQMHAAWDYGVDKFWQLAHWLRDMFATVTTDFDIMLNGVFSQIPIFGTDKYDQEK